MQRFGLALASGWLLFGTAALAQSSAPSGPQVLDLFHDGWYFNGEPRVTAEARNRGGEAGDVFAVGCNGTAPRILLDFRAPPYFLGFRSDPAKAGINSDPKATRSARVKFTFVKHSFAAVLTSRFDTKNERAVVARLVTPGNASGPTRSGSILIDGADAIDIVTQLKSMDQVSATVGELGEPASFELTNAKASIDKLLTVCTSGP
jgi:hypothetical protein